MRMRLKSFAQLLTASCLLVSHMICRSEVIYQDSLMIDVDQPTAQADTPAFWLASHDTRLRSKLKPHMNRLLSEGGCVVVYMYDNTRQRKTDADMAHGAKLNTTKYPYEKPSAIGALCAKSQPLRGTYPDGAIIFYTLWPEGHDMPCFWVIFPKVQTRFDRYDR
jgi:hypothetical protein